MSLEQAHNFKTTFRNRTLSSLLRVNRERPPGTRRAPEKIVLDVAPGVTASGKPPVRIFVGTEPAQFRAERVFVWSIMGQRDPARVYEIYLMKDLVGFNRRGWKTGFTCYRYAIPTFVGGSGRAIYNDVDQIYLADPGELFDMDMDGKGMLGINERETSVMLLDCEKMIRIWHFAEAQRGEKHNPFRTAVHAAKLWGQLPGVWNARDGEYVAGQSKVLHFTTLQTQPWQPFPDELRYEPHPLTDLWHGLERAADAACFTVFTKSRPSRSFHEDAGQLPTQPHADSIQPAVVPTGNASIDALMREHQAHTVFAYTTGPITGTFDAVTCANVLEHLHDDDIAWTLDELFAHARRFVHVAVQSSQTRKARSHGPRAPITLQPAHWWHEQIAAAGRRHPGVTGVLSTV